jgi:hypothetical protein
MRSTYIATINEVTTQLTNEAQYKQAQQNTIPSAYESVLRNISCVF